MAESSELPPAFLNGLAELEQAYLAETDPIRQSGFAGGAARWEAERRPILRAIERDGEIIDIGCANGYLLECLVEWGRAKGVRLVPYGLDQGAALVRLARARFPALASHFYVGNAWDWQPPRRYRYAYTLYDCVPQGFLSAYVRRLLDEVVAPGGRLIVGAYGSRSDQVPPFDIAGFLEKNGFAVAGKAYGGDPPVTAFAWIDRAVAPRRVCCTNKTPVLYWPKHKPLPD